MKSRQQKPSIVQNVRIPYLHLQTIVPFVELLSKNTLMEKFFQQDLAHAHFHFGFILA
jgi:hypothetical protein